MRGLFLLAAVFAVIAAPFLARASEPDPSELLGNWMAESEKIAIELYRCEEYLCGKIIWVIKPYRNNGEFKRDKRNPDPALRQRGYCGIEVVRGLRGKNDRVWRHGTFYYPKKGRSFDLDIKLKDDDRLELRAYLGIRLLGMSETWLRPDPDRTLACVPTPES
jgi:uncharacterized protein (DUF2147 family)